MTPLRLVILVRTAQTRPDPTRPDPTRPDPTRPDPTQPDPTRLDSTRLDLTRPDSPAAHVSSFRGSSYYDSPVTVEISHSKEVEPAVYDREVTLSVLGRKFCVAKSLVVSFAGFYFTQLQ